MSELIVEIWGIYSSTVFGKKATQHAVAHATGSKDERKGNVRQQSRHLRSLPYGSKFLGAVQVGHYMFLLQVVYYWTLELHTYGTMQWNFCLPAECICCCG